MKQVIGGLAIMGFLSFLLGCSRGPAKLPQILSETEEGFVDMVFAVAEAVKLPSGDMRITVRSMAEGGTVAFSVVLTPPWEERTLGEGITTYKGLLTFQRCGPESDALVKFMDSAHRTHLVPAGMSDNIRFTAISLEGHPGHIEKGAVKIKLFFEGDDEKDYAEVYLNIDLGVGKLWINEKDEAYRDPLVRAMSRK